MEDLYLLIRRISSTRLYISISNTDSTFLIRFSIRDGLLLLPSSSSHFFSRRNPRKSGNSAKMEDSSTGIYFDLWVIWNRPNLIIVFQRGFLLHRSFFDVSKAVWKHLIGAFLVLPPSKSRFSRRFVVDSLTRIHSSFTEGLLDYGLLVGGSTLVIALLLDAFNHVDGSFVIYHVMESNPRPCK